MPRGIQGVYILNKIFVFIDSDCVVCNKFALFCLKHEDVRDVHFYFAGLNSDYAKCFFKKKNYSASGNSIVVFKNNRFFLQSNGMIEVAKNLKRPFSFLSIVQIIPSVLRNKIYDIVSKHRHSFAKKSICPVIPSHWKDRFFN